MSAYKMTTNFFMIISFIWNIFEIISYLNIHGFESKPRSALLKMNISLTLTLILHLQIPYRMMIIFRMIIRYFYFCWKPSSLHSKNRSRSPLRMRSKSPDHRFTKLFHNFSE